MSRARVLVAFSIAILFALTPASAPVAVAAAQTSADGSIRGRVTDGQGAVLPGVIVSARSPNVGGASSAVSDAAGGYRLINLPPGADYTAARGWTRRLTCST